MSYGTKRRQLVQELLFDGYTQEQIATKLNVSERTVRRDVKKIRESSDRWLDDLFPKKLVQIFREGLEGIKKDMLILREMLNEESVKNDVPMKIKIIRSISELRGDYMDLISHTPMVWSTHKFVKKNELKSNDGKPNPTVYGEFKAYEYQEPSTETKTYSDPHYESKFKN